MYAIRSYYAEDQTYINDLKAQCDVPIIKALNMEQYDENSLVSADFYLLDHGT